MSASESDTKIHIRRARSGLPSVGIQDLWEYRDLIWILCRREVAVRYKQTFLGFAWAVIVPFMTMVVFTLIFGKLAKMPSDGLPYPIFLFCGLLPWQLFARALTDVSNSVVANEPLVKKVYFPRLVLPISLVGVAIVDFVVAFAILLAMMLFYGIEPGWAVLTVPFLVLYAMCAALGIGLWFAALNVKYRDVRHLLPFLTQLWFFATPVVYPASIVSEPWRTLMAINPMAGVVDGFRWALLNGAAPSALNLALSMGTTAVLLLGGIFFFRIRSRTFADNI